MPELRLDLVWPRTQDAPSTKKVGPWTPVENLCEYTSAQKYGYPYPNAPLYIIEPPEHYKCKKPPIFDRQVTNQTYETTSGKAYDWKFQFQDPINKADLPAFHKFNFLSTVDEKLRAHPLRPIRKLSEFKSKYPRHTELHSSGVLRDQKTNMFCPIKGLTRDDVTKFDVSENGFGKHLDIYVSRSKMDYIHHKPDITNVYKDKGVYCKSAFPAKKAERKRIQRDHTDMLQLVKVSPKMYKSETAAEFVVPVAMTDPISDCMIPNIKQTIGEVLAIPGMYHTEYSHIGQDCRRKPLPLKQLRYLDNLEKIKTVSFKEY